MSLRSAERGLGEESIDRESESKSDQELHQEVPRERMVIVYCARHNYEDTDQSLNLAAAVVGMSGVTIQTAILFFRVDGSRYGNKRGSTLS